MSVSLALHLAVRVSFAARDVISQALWVFVAQKQLLGVVLPATDMRLTHASL